MTNSANLRNAVPCSASVFKSFCNDERGATSIEYSLIVGLIFLAIVGTVGTMSTSMTGLYETVSTAIGS